jgi:hypothetical protein
MTWICAALSVTSSVEYIWVNRAILGQLAQHGRGGGAAA